MNIGHSTARRALTGRRRIALLAVTLAGVSVVGLATAGSASAACASGYVCLYENSNYGGAKASFVGNNPNFTQIPKSDGGSWNDVMSSVQNNGTSGLGVNFYYNIDYSGGSFCIARGYNIASLTGGNNDTASANYWTSTCHS